MGIKQKSAARYVKTIPNKAAESKNSVVVSKKTCIPSLVQIFKHRFIIGARNVLYVCNFLADLSRAIVTSGAKLQSLFNSSTHLDLEMDSEILSEGLNENKISNSLRKSSS